jgi:hypothetical protein
MTNEPDDTYEINISVPILKEVARQLHLAAAHHRRVVLRGKKNRKKHDFNFRHKLHKDGREKDEAHLKIYAWMQDQKKYNTKPLCYVFYYKNSLIMKEHWCWWTDEEDICRVEIANPDCFDVLSKKLIKLLDWRG